MNDNYAYSKGFYRLILKNIGNVSTSDVEIVIFDYSGELQMRDNDSHFNFSKEDREKLAKWLLERDED